MLNFLGIRPKRHFNIKKTVQITDSHCGPAVIQMLLSNLGHEHTQDEITRAAGVVTTIARNGTRVDQLAQAVRRLIPETIFWFKEHATLDDIRTILREYKFPVGVEWQGVFGQKSSGRLETDGHYSVITSIDDEKRYITMVDPYEDFKIKDRVISIHRFVRLWWDTNNYVLKNNKVKIIKDTRLLFVITPYTFQFPKEMGMKTGDKFKRVIK